MADNRDKWQKKDTSRSEDEKLDDALEDSFPACDPPAATDPLSKVGSKRKSPAQTPHD
jgi:hypothetical protein